MSSADFRVHTLLETYRSARWIPHEHLLVVGLEQREDREFDFCIARSGANVGDVVRVCFTGIPKLDLTGWREESYTEAQSLQAMVLRYAFVNNRILGREYVGMLVPKGSDSQLEPELTRRMDHVMSRNGLRRLALHDEWTRYYLGDGLAAHYNRPRGVAHQVFVGGAKAKVTRLGGKVQSALGWSDLGTVATKSI